MRKSKEIRDDRHTKALLTGFLVGQNHSVRDIAERVGRSVAWVRVQMTLIHEADRGERG